MRYHFNNCRGRDHARYFGPTAFYDLNFHGIQETQATNLRAGDECVVATYNKSGDVSFTWFAFSHEEIMPAKAGSGSEKFRVQFWQVAQNGNAILSGGRS